MQTKTYKRLLKISVIAVLNLIFVFSAIVYAAWSNKLNISQTSNWSGSSHVVSAGGKVYIVWSESMDIYFKWFNGSTWSSKTKVNTGTFDFTDYPKIAAANGKVHIVWVHYASSQSEVYYRRFNGSTWSTIQNVSQTSGDAYNPQVVAYQNNAYIVWEEDKNKDYSSDEIYYRRFNGSSWSTVKNVSETSSSESDEPSVSVDGGKVRITWTENISGNREIFYRSFSP